MKCTWFMNSTFSCFFSPTSAGVAETEILLTGCQWSGTKFIMNSWHFSNLSHEHSCVQRNVNVSLITCLWMARSMLVAVAWNACRVRPSSRLFPGKSGGTLFTKLARKARGTGTGFHPQSRRKGWVSWDDCWGHGYSCELWCVWQGRKRRNVKDVNTNLSLE